MANLFNSRINNNNHNTKKSRYKPIALAIAVAMTNTLTSNAIAATYTVTTIADSGEGSLRQAVLDANATNDVSDNIIFDTNLAGSIITLNSALVINDTLTITGPSVGDANSIILDGNQTNQIINSNFSSSTDTKSLTLENITLRNALYDGTEQPNRNGGGAIYVNNANLIINHGLITNNKTMGSKDSGGGIYLVNGDLILNNTTVSNNNINGNSADGGGVFVNYGDATINNSTISGNTALKRGGGLRVRLGNTKLNQSTVSGNSSTAFGGGGGGIFTNGGETIIISSTITNNTSATNGAGISVNLFAAEDRARFTNTILSGNTVIGRDNIDNFTNRSSTSEGTLSLEFSLFSDNQTEVNGTNTGNQFNLNNNPNLGPLQDNGGPTFTHLPNLDSLIINAGGGLILDGEVDQRGSDFPRIAFGALDIGAVELQENEADFSYDIDNNGEVAPLTDGLLALRYLFGFRDDALIANAVASDATRNAAIDIESYLFNGIGIRSLDIDGNDEVKPLTDGLLVLRYQFGFRGDSLIQNAIGHNATRNTAMEIESFLE